MIGGGDDLVASALFSTCLTMSTNVNLALGTVTCTAASISGSASLGGTLTTAGLQVPQLPYAYFSGIPNAQNLGSGASTVGAGIGYNGGDAVLGNAWNAGVFTAPYNGLFYLDASMRCTNIGNYAIWWTPSWIAVAGQIDGLGENAGVSGIILQASTTVQMLQGQSLTLRIYNSNSGWNYSGFFLVQLLARTN